MEVIAMPTYIKGMVRKDSEGVRWEWVSGGKRVGVKEDKGLPCYPPPSCNDGLVDPDGGSDGLDSH